ncbi:MAG: hypothetical protein LUG60_00815 [Erysipelotrichaceae bacterium]|nr:hypothetical protein [Erysipelotrichaceae bacterium]
MSSWTNEDKLEKMFSSNDEEVVEETIEPIIEEEVKEETKPDMSSEQSEELLEKLDTIIELLQAKPQEEDSNDVSEIAKNQERNRNLLTQYIKQNAEFQQQVRIDMNKENESLKKEILGERLDPLLKAIATVYGDYYRLLDENATEDKNYQKQVLFMFESIEDVLSEYGCEFNTTDPGEERSPKSTKIRNPMIPTADQSLHRTVIQSFNPSISKGKKVLYPEYVSIYKYDETLVKEETKEEAIEVVETVENTETIEKEIIEEGEN